VALHYYPVPVQAVLAEPWAPPQLFHTDLMLENNKGIDISNWLKQPKLPIGLLWSGEAWNLQVLDGPPTFARWRSEMDDTAKDRQLETVSLQLKANEGFCFRCANPFFTPEIICNVSISSCSVIPGAGGAMFVCPLPALPGPVSFTAAPPAICGRAIIRK